jgi:hypothetical protein
MFVVEKGVSELEEGTYFCHSITTHHRFVTSMHISLSLSYAKVELVPNGTLEVKAERHNYAYGTTMPNLS